MKVLLCPFHYFDKQRAGAESYLHKLALYLIEQGHEVKVIAVGVEQHTFEGVEIYPQGNFITSWVENNDLFEWCDIAITHLLGESFAYNKAYIQHKKPLVIIAHNAVVRSIASYNQDVHFILNSDTAKEALGYTQNSFVLHPPVDYKKFKPAALKGRKYVTLVNCNINKGGYDLMQLAEELPEVEFMGVLGGYDKQITTDELPNLTYHETVDDIKEVLKETLVLIMPSTRESYGQVATEAACMGIPVVASDLPGVRENLGDAGIYVQTFSELHAAVNGLVTDKAHYKEYSDKVLERAKELDPEKELKACEKWLLKIIKDARRDN